MTRTADRAGAATGRMMRGLSAAQVRMWFMDRVWPGARVAQLTAQLRLSGSVEPQRLRVALDALVGRHARLRTRIVESSSTGAPEVTPAGDLAAQLIVVRLEPPAPGADTYAEARAIAKRQAEQAFDLATELPIRAQLVSMSDDDHLLSVTVHRIAADEAAMSIIFAELGQLYAGRHLAIAETPTDAWAELEEAERARRLDFWVHRLDGSVPAELPASHPRPAHPSGQAGQAVRWLAPHIAEQVRSFGDSDPSVVLLAGFVAVLSRYGGPSEVVIGVDPIAWPQRAGSVGYGLDPVPLRVDITDRPNLAELVRRCRIGWAEATANQAPLLELVRHNSSWRRTDRHPLFQVTFGVFTSEPEPEPEPEHGWPAEPGVTDVPAERSGLAEDLRLELWDRPEGLAVSVAYATDLFEHSRMEQMLAHLETMLVAAVAQPQRTVAELPLVTARERRALLSDWQGPTIPYRLEPVHQQILQRAIENPDVVAVRLGDEELTYAELVRRARALAHYLRARDLKREDIVAVAMDRSIEVYVALVGVLMAGCAFVMIDPNHPQNRISFLLEDTATEVLLTRTAHLGLLPRHEHVHTLCVDGDRATIDAADGGEAPAEWADHDSLAYVLYTSGSTGKPKGVLIEHGALSNFLLWLSWTFDLGPGDRMLQHMALVFDFAQGEIFTALTSGATMVLVPEESRTDPVAIGRLLRTERITYLGGPPAILSRLPDDDYPEWKYVVVGGEAFGADLVNKLAVGQRRFINGYGPTEAAVGCISYECEHKHWQTPPPIGRAMPNRYAYVVDAYDQLAPVGVPGEILVGGAGLARGYLNSPELTQRRFITDPFRPPARAYRTGDLGMWTENGQIHFLGRIDSQVKVNGLRVELEEIESVLSCHPAVSQAAVVVKRDRYSVARLAGFVVTGEPVTNDELRRHLGEELPSYMVPGTFARLDALPLTPVGKVDRDALRAIEDGGADERDFVAPYTLMQQRIAEAFRAVLGIDGVVGVDDGFFDLGGDSLAAIHLLHRLRADLGVSVPLSGFYAEATVAALAQLIERAALRQDVIVDPDEEDRRILAEVSGMSDAEVARLMAGGVATEGVAP